MRAPPLTNLDVVVAPGLFRAFAAGNNGGAATAGATAASAAPPHPTGAAPAQLHAAVVDVADVLSLYPHARADGSLARFLGDVAASVRVGGSVLCAGAELVPSSAELQHGRSSASPPHDATASSHAATAAMLASLGCRSVGLHAATHALAESVDAGEWKHSVAEAVALLWAGVVTVPVTTYGTTHDDPRRADGVFADAGAALGTHRASGSGVFSSAPAHAPRLDAAVRDAIGSGLGPRPSGSLPAVCLRTPAHRDP